MTPGCLLSDTHNDVRMFIVGYTWWRQDVYCGTHMTTSGCLLRGRWWRQDVYCGIYMMMSGCLLWGRWWRQDFYCVTHMLSGPGCLLWDIQQTSGPGCLLWDTQQASRSGCLLWDTQQASRSGRYWVTYTHYVYGRDVYCGKHSVRLIFGHTRTLCVRVRMLIVGHTTGMGVRVFTVWHTTCIRGTHISEHNTKSRTCNV